MSEDRNISVAKIVATPSESSWAQAYSAGKLFAVLSLESEEELKEKDYLNLLGKGVLETLEQEFFTLEVKDLSSIKNAIQITAGRIPHDISCSFVVASITNDDALYVFTIGAGRVDIKRGDEFGNILESKELKSSEISSASGILQDSDFIIIQTRQFTEIITSNILIGALDHQAPQEISEILAPIIHDQDKGGSAAIIIEYKFIQPEQNLNISDEEEISPEGEEEKEEPKSIPQKFSGAGNYFNPLIEKIKLSKFRNINHSRKIILTIALIILIVFILTINFAIRKQNDAKIQNLFNDIYPKAEKEYEAGMNLVELNKNLAQDNFRTALKILKDGKSKFPKDSNEQKQILELLAKVEKALEANSPEKIAQNQERKKISISVENGSGIEGAAGKASDFLKEKGYNVISTGNAKNYNYKGVTIKVKNSTKSYLELIKKDLSGKYTVTDSTSDLSQDFPSDALIIVGK